MQLLSNDRTELRERIKRLRHVRRWDQALLAKRAGCSPSVISQIELGRVTPTDEQVERIAEALGYTSDFLRADLGMIPSTRPWLRAYADASKREADARSDSCTTAVEYLRLLALDPLPDLLPIFRESHDDEWAIEDVANEVRDICRIERNAVISNAIRVAEQLGCLVLPFESEVGRHFGMSVRVDQVPVICVAYSQTVPGDRQRFTVAHELGHLIVHARSAPPRDSAEAARMENQANRFAAALLAPGEPIIEMLAGLGGKVTLTNLIAVKKQWGVSIKSLVGRYKSLGVIDEDQARSLYKQISARRWTVDEPEPIEPERAGWLGRAIQLKAKSKSLREASEFLAHRIGGRPDELYGFASWEFPVVADVVDMAMHRRQRA